MSVSFTPCLSHPSSQDLCTPWNTPCTPVYRRTHVRDLQLHALDWTARKTGGTHCLPWRLSTKTGRWMHCHRHMVYTDSAYWDSGAVTAQQLANVPVWIKKRPMSVLYCCLWCSYWQSCETELTKVPACYVFVDVHVEPYRLKVLRHHWHCCICSYCHNLVSSGSPPVFHEHTSITVFAYHIWVMCHVRPKMYKQN